MDPESVQTIVQVSAVDDRDSQFAVDCIQRQE